LSVGLREKEPTEAKVAALMQNLTVAVMQAETLAVDSPEYQALAEILAYALDLMDLGLSSESSGFDPSSELQEAH
jgi:hypothetical protein